MYKHNELLVSLDLLLFLPQAPKDEHQQRYCCAWQTDELIAVGALALSIMDMVSCMGAGMEVVVGNVAGNTGQKGWWQFLGAR